MIKESAPSFLPSGSQGWWGSLGAGNAEYVQFLELECKLIESSLLFVGFPLGGSLILCSRSFRKIGPRVYFSLFLLQSR